MLEDFAILQCYIECLKNTGNGPQNSIISKFFSTHFPHIYGEMDITDIYSLMKIVGVLNLKIERNLSHQQTYVWMFNEKAAIQYSKHEHSVTHYCNLYFRDSETALMFKMKS